MRARGGSIRRLFVHMGLTAAVATLGLGLGAAGNPVRADGCEDDICSRVCGVGVCTGDCYHSTGSDRNCDELAGGDCEVTQCGAQ